MATLFGPKPEDIAAARRDIHRELVIRKGGVWTLPASADTALKRAVAELEANNLVTVDDRRVTLRHGTTDHDIDALAAARSLLLILELRSPNPITDDVHTLLGKDFDTAEIDAGVKYLCGWKLAKLVNGALLDNTGTTLRTRKSEGALTSVIRAKRKAENTRIRADFDAITASDGGWFAHPDDDKWTPEALVTIRRGAWKELLRIPGGLVIALTDYRAHLRKAHGDHAESVFDRLIAAEFITVIGDQVKAHEALPEAKKAPTPAPDPTPEPAPVTAAPPADPLGDVGDIADVPDLGIAAPPAPKPAPAPVPVPATSDVKPLTPNPEPVVEQTSEPETKPEVVQVEETAPAPAAPAAGTAPPKKVVSPQVSQPETTAPTTIGDQILAEVREVRRDLRAALAPITAPKVDTDAARDVLASSDVMTKKVLVRVIVLLHVKGELPRTALRKKMNSRWLAFLPDAIRLGLRIGVLDANAQGGKALRLIDHSKVITTAELERLAAEQRARDGDEDDSNSLLGGLAHAARTLTGAVS